jgi:hypothetical protein
LAALRRYGIPDEVLADNGKQFTARFGHLTASVAAVVVTAGDGSGAGRCGTPFERLRGL